MTETVGFIGLGTMGGPMAWNIRRAGYPLGVYNRTPERVAPFGEGGVPVHEHPGALAVASDVVIIMVTDPAALDSILTDAHGVLAGLQRGALVINMSTVSREATLRAATQVEDAGGRFVDAPVSGTKKPAETGALTVLAGGQENDLARAEPILDTMSKAIVRCGDVGQGTDMKHTVNLLLAAMMQGFSEALVFGRKRGLGMEAMIEAMTTGATDSPLYQMKGQAIRSGDFSKSFPVNLLLKDLDLVLQAGRESGAYLPVTAATREAVSAGNACGYGDEDMAALVKLLEHVAGVQARDPD